MKQTLLTISITLFCVLANAQTVDIPNPAFKQYLLDITEWSGVAKNEAGQSIVVDINNDNEVQLSEALTVWELAIEPDFNLEGSLEGISSFTNLRKLIVSADTESLDLTALVNLKEFICGYCEDLQSLNVQGLADLEILSVEFSGLTALTLQSNTSLKKIFCEYSPVQTINIQQAPNLEELDVHYCHDLAGLDVSNMSNLKRLRADWTAITSLDFTGTENIEDIDLLEAYVLTSLEVSNLPNLKSFAVGDCYELTGLELGYMPQLESFHFSGGPVPSLSLEGCPSLNNIFISIDDATTYLNLKNGDNSYTNATFFMSSESPVYVCVDEGEEVYFENILGNPTIYLSTYCTYQPGGNYNTVAGSLSFDAEGEGCNPEINYPMITRVDINSDSGNGIAYSNIDGGYTFFVQDATSYTLAPQFENDWFTATPASATINVAAIDNTTTTQNFCITPNGVHPDVEVVITPLDGAQPGFDVAYKIVYKNKGNQVLSGDVTLNFDDERIDYLSSAPVQTGSSAGFLGWSYFDLLPFESRNIILNFNVNSPQETPAVNIDDVLAFTVAISPFTGDETVADNAFHLDHVVTGSFDPNDITCLEGASVPIDKIGEYLHYNINFENTGTAPATFIVVEDVIDEAQFDISTLQILDASHNMTTQLNGNKIIYRFDNINLGTEEKGNIVFKIKTLNTLQVNDDVTQRANIFFDYNFPIETNEANTVFAALSLGSFEQDATVKVFPNPANDIITIAAASNIQSLELYDIQGRLLQSATVNDAVAKMDVSHRAVGMYFLKIKTEAGIKVEKLVKE